jgi:hypothetical protein
VPLVPDVPELHPLPKEVRRPSILPSNWSKTNVNPVSSKSEEPDVKIAITLSLIEGLDRETDL